MFRCSTILLLMKKALILHGTDGSSQDNWFQWLGKQLERLNYQVWIPDLPDASKPNIQRYNKFIFANNDFQIDDNTIIVGHSSGSVAILGLLSALPAKVKVKACYLVGSFKDDLGWEKLTDLFIEPFDFAKIKSKSRLWYFIHSDNDPYCPLDHAEFLHQQIGGDLLVLPGQKHFSVVTAGESYRQFPYLYHLIAEDTMTAAEVLEIYQAMEKQGVEFWIDGGWAVDALLEKQTRPHGDLDIVIQKRDVPALVKYLSNKGYSEVHRSDSSDHNFMMGNSEPQFVDFHVIEMDEQGNGLYGPKENQFIFPADSLTGNGKINGQTVRSLSPEWVVKFHSGYELREKDYHDVLAICQKFGIEVPAEYKNKN